MQFKNQPPNLSSDNNEAKLVEIDNQGNRVIHPIFKPESPSVTDNHTPVILGENGLPLPSHNYNNNPFFLPPTQGSFANVEGLFGKRVTQKPSSRGDSLFNFSDDIPPTHKHVDPLPNKPGFFTPFTRGVGDFVGTLLCPITSALAFGALSFFAGILTVVCAAACLICLLLALAARVTGEKELGQMLLKGSGYALLGTILAPIASLVFAFLAIISIPVNFIALVTRSAATVGWAIGKVFGIKDCCEDKIEFGNHEEIVSGQFQPSPFGASA